MIMHFGFSFTFATLYVLAAEFFPIVKLWQGAAFGALLWIAFHEILLPAMGTKPPPWDQPSSRAFIRIIRPLVLFLDGGVSSTIL